MCHGNFNKNLSFIPLIVAEKIMFPLTQIDVQLYIIITANIKKNGKGLSILRKG